MEVRLIQNTFTDRKLYVTKWSHENPVNLKRIQQMQDLCEKMKTPYEAIVELAEGVAKRLQEEGKL